MAPGAANPENPVVFFDITLGGEELGRIKIELFADIAPRTAENFRKFCTGETNDPESGKPQGYKGCKFHRVVPSFIIQSGDFIKGDGTGSRTTFGTQYFDDENFRQNHNDAGILSMANSGPNTNGCQFFITLKAVPQLNGKYVAFGRVIEGLDIVEKIGMIRTNNEQPVLDVIIKQCGEM